MVYSILKGFFVKGTKMKLQKLFPFVKNGVPIFTDTGTFYNFISAKFCVWEFYLTQSLNLFKESYSNL